MKTSFYYLLSSVLMIIIGTGKSSVQDIGGGTVKYEQVIMYNFSSIRDDEGMDNNEWNNFIVGLPKEGKAVTVLHFSGKVAFYEEDITVHEAQPKRLQRLLNSANRGNPPEPKLKKVYYDFGKNEKIEQVEFMTRDFLVKSGIEKQDWKISDKKKNVLKYICLGAVKQKGNSTITAWFASDIPISTGPAEYYGLPGLILEIAVNGVVTYTATSIDLTPPKMRLLSLPKDGKKVNQKEFDKIVKEKVEEYKKEKAEGMRRERKRERDRER